MGGEHVAGKDAGNLAGGVKRDVDDKGWVGAQRDLAHFFPDRIADRHAPSRVRVTDHGVTVIAVDALRAGNRGQHAFRPAAEAGKEMRLDEPGQDPHIGFVELPVDANGMAARRAAERNEVGIGVRVVLLAVVIVHDVVAEHLAQLSIGLRPVRAERVEQGDVAARDAGGFQFGEQDRQ